MRSDPKRVIKGDKRLKDVPEHLDEEYYQISQDILNSFSKYRPPVNIYRFLEEVARIEIYYKVGQRLSNEQVEELARLTDEGFVFVSRADHPVYAKHIAHQLDLVLLDKHLRGQEIASIFIHALTMRMENFLNQPVKAVFERLREDVLVLTQYLIDDIYRIKGLIRRMHAEHTLANHSVNCAIMGLALFGRMQEEDFKKRQVKRKTFDNLAIGLLIHDMGMSKVPSFLRDKGNRLTPDELSTVLQHPRLGLDMLTRLDARYPEIEGCVLEHHERLNGSGYPQKLSGTEISFPGRLCAVIDSYCAMITKRPYAEPMSPVQAAAILARDEKRYDPRISRILQSMIMIREQIARPQAPAPEQGEPNAAPGPSIPPRPQPE